MLLQLKSSVIRDFKDRKPSLSMFSIELVDLKKVNLKRLSMMIHKVNLHQDRFNFAAFDSLEKICRISHHNSVLVQV